MAIMLERLIRNSKNANPGRLETNEDLERASSGRTGGPVVTNISLYTEEGRRRVEIIAKICEGKKKS